MVSELSPANTVLAVYCNARLGNFSKHDGYVVYLYHVYYMHQLMPLCVQYACISMLVYAHLPGCILLSVPSCMCMKNSAYVFTSVFLCLMCAQRHADVYETFFSDLIVTTICPPELSYGITSLPPSSLL